MRFLGYLAVHAITVFSSKFVSAEPFEIVMDYYPPFSYEERGVAKGICTDVVNAVLQKIERQAVITQLPFARAYKKTMEGQGVYEFCVVRTPQREKLFQWVGVVGPAEQALIAKKDSKIVIEDIFQLKKYHIGLVVEDVVDQHLSIYETKYKLNIERVPSYEVNMKKLLNGRIDIWGGNLHVGFYLIKKLGEKMKDYEVVYNIKSLKGNYYLVTGLKTDKNDVAELKEGFEQVYSSRLYQTIVNSYLGSN
ncbi:substrate-binding periplasmic protein [Zooshikella harenae]|uniref:ABC transporter substrate-binding protein n=1 Tax=Zooshikella harenae TaxID=2827238 RepID=A0ABS5ZAT1_9GAMM|nr:ABC transporter substrate-binding protein [Zooshikella harenae]MBU2710401.1 ABC transporter substrate-binding protein [Zooshikella harenae]